MSREIRSQAMYLMPQDWVAIPALTEEAKESK